MHGNISMMDVLGAAARRGGLGQTQYTNRASSATPTGVKQSNGCPECPSCESNGCAWYWYAGAALGLTLGLGLVLKALSS